jgi:hypothetical protein
MTDNQQLFFSSTALGGAALSSLAQLNHGAALLHGSASDSTANPKYGEAGSINTRIS